MRCLVWLKLSGRLEKGLHAKTSKVNRGPTFDEIEGNFLTYGWVLMVNTFTRHRLRNSDG